MKKVFQALIVLVFLFIIKGCVSTTPQYTAKNNKELTIYAALEEEQVNEYIQGFREMYPEIKVNIITDSHGVISAKLISEKDNPQADIVWGLSAINMIDIKERGLLNPYMPKNINEINERFMDDSEIPYWIGMNATETAFVVNYKELEKLGLKIPESYEDLIKPEYKGLITMPNPASSGTGYFTVSAVLQLMGEDEGFEYMSKLHENIGVYTHSGSKPAKLAGSGEYPIGISFGYRGVTQMQTGEPVKVIFPKEGSGWDLESIAEIKKTTIKEESNLFMEWALSEEAMEKYAKSSPITSIETDIEIPVGYLENPIDQLIENDLVWASKNRSEILKKWENNYGSKSESK